MRWSYPVGRTRQWSLLLALLALLSACQVTAPQRSDAVIASDNDTRAFRYLELPNRLRVLLISDPNADKAAAALDVGVGSRQDPADRPGLAHFLEHMLFLGTDRYPEAGDYQNFISAHSGNHNAYTAFEHTNYFFDIDARYLEPALDRFSRFFVAPLFTAAYVDREKNAVNSEYMANIRDDLRRGLDVLRESVNPEHPFSQFSVGSLDTLADRPQRPVRADLLEFYARHYSANIMTLVVMGREPLDELQHMVTPRFSAIPNRQVKIDTVATPLFRTEALPELVQIKPVQEQRTLSFSWPIGDTRADYRGKSLEYIGNIIGHEGTGSLLSLLKQRGWAHALGAGQGFDYQGGALFNVSVELTEAGAQHVDEIALALYQTINRIRDGGIQEWLYREQQRVAEQRFRFRERPDPTGEVSHLAGNLQDYPPAEVMRGDYLMEQFNPQRIRALLDQLAPERMLMTLTTPDAVADRSSKYYQTPYSKTPIAPQQVERWRSAGVSADIRLPEPNIFIASDLALKPLPQEAARKPALVRAQPGLHVWFLQDPAFRLPKASVSISVRSPLAGGSAERVVLSELLVRMVEENLNEFSYPASLAGLSYDISRDSRSISVRVAGFNDRQPVLLERILGALRHPQFDRAQFTRVAQEYRRELLDSAKRTPYQLLMSDINNVLYRDQWPDSELAPLVAKVDVARLQEFAAQLFASVDVHMLVHGNYVEADAQQLAALVQTQLLSGANAVASPTVQVLQLPERFDVRRTLAAPHDDAALLWYRQAADNSKSTRAALGVSAQMLSADFYSTLRTEQQVGYIVTSSPYPVRDVPGLMLLAQSTSKGPEQLAQAYQAFLREWSQRDEQALRPLFERHRAALAQRLAEGPKNLGEASDRLWQDLNTGYLQFDSRAQITAAVKALTFEQWLALFRRDVLGNDGRSLWLSVNGRFKDSALQRGQSADDLGRFKAARNFYTFP